MNRVLVVPESSRLIDADFPDFTLRRIPDAGIRHGWPTLEVLRAAAGRTELLAWTSSQDANDVCLMLNVIPTADASIVFADEPVPADLLQRLPAEVHGLLRRPGSMDLIAFQTRWLASQSDHRKSCAEAVFSAGPDVVALPRASPSSRFPDVGPGYPMLSQQSVSMAARSVAHALGCPEEHGSTLTAGLLLLHDHLEESHQLAQRLEGHGQPRTADYWHAIMHRREPDPDNSRYWFRRVGRHPAFEELAGRMVDWLETAGSLQPGDKNVLPIARDGNFDPMAMVKLTQMAMQDVGGRCHDIARRIQYFEILNLLNWSLCRTA
jgi:hypothetical protein